MSFLSQTAAFFAVSESKMGTEAAPHQADDRTLADEGREAGGMNWKHCQLNAVRRDRNSLGKKTKDLTQSQLIVAKRIGVASPHPLLLALHRNGLKESRSSLQSLSCYPPQFCCTYPGKHNFKSGFWLRSSHESSNTNHSKKQSSRVKSSKARGRGAHERLRYGTDKDFGLFHCTAL